MNIVLEFIVVLHHHLDTKVESQVTRLELVLCRQATGDLKNFT